MTYARATTTHDAPRASRYEPGVCNIGPAEIRRRRMAGHIGVIATLVVLAALIILDAPPVARLILILPAAGAASGYLQAWFRFCAGFGSRGIFNFEALGDSTTITDPDALARDRRRSREIGGMALAIGVAIGIAAALLPF
jgi:hypothetical protein